MTSFTPISLLKLLPVVLLMLACGRPPCDAHTCPTGCCSASGECVSSPTVQACGAGGAQCDTCQLGQSCLLGRCMGASGAGGGGGSNSGTGPSCSSSSNCPNWFCDCSNGPVNAAHCTNGRCESGAQACPGACAAFNACWLGTSSGGFSGGSNVGPGTCGSTGTTGGGGFSASCSVSDLGRGCQQGSDCQAGLCFGISPSFICTQSCSVANDCPFGWTCEVSSQGNRICMQGAHSGGATSTSAVCSPAPITDVGNSCGNCQSGFCTSNLCSKRCVTSSDCPPSWRCLTTSGSFNFCAP